MANNICPVNGHIQEHLTVGPFDRVWSESRLLEQDKWVTGLLKLQQVQVMRY